MWCRVLREGEASSKPPLGRNWGPGRGGMHQIGPLRDWAGEGEGRGLGCAGPEGAELIPGRSQLPVSTAPGLRLASFLGLFSYPLLPASRICQPRRQTLEVSVPCFFTFRGLCPRPQFLSCPRLPGLDHSPGLQCPRRECLTQRPYQPERDGGAGVPRR